MIYGFEDYALDTNRRELRRASEVVPIEPQVFEVLELLVRAHPNIVSIADLIASVWDRRIVSNSTISSRISAARAAIGDSGKTQRLIQTFSRRGFRFAGAVRIQEDPAQRPPAEIPKGARERPPLLDKPSISVLPFVSIPQDEPRHREFVYGVVESIMTQLSQFRWLSVVERGPAPVSGNWSLELAADRATFSEYLLEGSIRKKENSFRVMARLIDAGTSELLLAHRFDLQDDDCFRLQDRISSNVVCSVASKLEDLQINRIESCPAKDLGSMQCYMRGLRHVYRWTRSDINEALGLFKNAIRLDVEFAPAYGMAAYCHVQRKSYGWRGSRALENAECETLAREAARLAKDDALTLARSAHAIASVVHDFDSGSIFVDQALKLNPTLGAAWYVSGWIRLFLGKTDEGVEHLGRAISLSQFDPLVFKMHAALGYAYFLSGRYDEATGLMLNALAARPSYLTAMRGAAASHALAGRLDQARNLMAGVHEQDPALRVSNLTDLIPFSRGRDLDRWSDGLRKAGLPD